ncbi:hypothetical protein C8J56DRAFT_1048365 [Mycena floridula]|nr:hypothetical protein C8J56DRAFT_1048365 [Mycena floridula]
MRSKQDPKLDSRAMVFDELGRSNRSKLVAFPGPGLGCMFDDAYKRCRSQDIDMSINIVDPNSVHPVIDLALQCSPHWRSIHFTGRFPPSLASVKGRLERLQVLRLHNVDLKQTWNLWDSELRKRIRTLGTKSVNEQVNSDQGDWKDIPGSSTHRTLSSLTTANIRILRSITCPALKELTIPGISTPRGMFLDHEDILVDIQQMLSRSNCSLTKLLLSESLLNETIFQAIASMPDLEELSLTSAMSDIFFSSLTRLLLSWDRICKSDPTGLDMQMLVFRALAVLQLPQENQSM